MAMTQAKPKHVLDAETAMVYFPKRVADIECAMTVDYFFERKAFLTCGKVCFHMIKGIIVDCSKRREEFFN